MKIGLFLPNWLGDLVMATPALRAVRRYAGAASRLVGIVRANLAGLLAGTDWLDEEWPLEPGAFWRRPGGAPGRRGVKRRRSGPLDLVRRMRRERFDMVLLFPNSFRPALLAWLGGARERIGYVRYGRGPLLTGKVYPPRKNGRLLPRPMVEYYLALAEAAGCPPESPRLELASTEAEQQGADRIWRDLGLRTDGRVIALNASGAYGAAKRWPLEHFGELGRRIARGADHDVLVVCGPGEREMAQAIVRHAGCAGVFSLADQPLGLGTSKACIGRSRLMVSTDSGPRHVAAAFGKPVITLFGPTMPVWTKNPTVQSVDLQLKLECSGCGKRTCPLGCQRCMRELSVDMVYREVVRLIERPSLGPGRSRMPVGAMERASGGRCTAPLNREAHSRWLDRPRRPERPVVTWQG
jgi:heptosyltransferase-2